MTKATVAPKRQHDRPGNDLLQNCPIKDGIPDGQEGIRHVLEDGLEAIKQIFENQMDQLRRNSNLDPACTILTLPEVAALCRVSLRPIQDAARNGQLPARKIGRVWRCRLDEILDWLRGPWRIPAPTKESKISHPQQVPNKNLPAWDWSNRAQNLGIELDNESSYSQENGKVPESSSSEGDFDER